MKSKIQDIEHVSHLYGYTHLIKYHLHTELLGAARETLNRRGDAELVGLVLGKLIFGQDFMTVIVHIN